MSIALIQLNRSPHDIFIQWFVYYFVPWMLLISNYGIRGFIQPLFNICISLFFLVLKLRHIIPTPFDPALNPRSSHY